MCVYCGTADVLCSIVVLVAQSALISDEERADESVDHWPAAIKIVLDIVMLSVVYTS
jgi:hypothetical protein